MRTIGTLTLGFGLAALGAHEAIGAAPIDQARYARAHDLIDVGQGRRLNLYCAGSGAPTVVFEAGGSLAGWDWLLVHPAIAAKTRACIYDRAGFGFSDPATRPGTSANAVDDLHTLLHVAGVAPPYVLVGHSSGGAYVQHYAYTYPSEVAGLVLVDASHEDEDEHLDRITKGKYSQLLAQLGASEQKCLAASHAGLTPGSTAFDECIGRPPEKFGAALGAAYLRQAMSSSYWDARVSEETNQATSNGQLRTARKSLGALPLVYLTHGVSPYLAPGRRPSEMNKATERDTVLLHDSVARLSSRGVHRVVARAAHSIHVDRPDAVITAIGDVLDQVRVIK